MLRPLILFYSGDLCWKVRNIFRNKNRKKNMRNDTGDPTESPEDSLTGDDLDSPMVYGINEEYDPNDDSSEFNPFEEQNFDTNNYDDDGLFDYGEGLMPAVASFDETTRKPKCKISRRDTLLSYYGTIFGEYFVP